MSSAPASRPIALAAGATLLAWLGEYIHNLVELPKLTITSPENSIPGLVFLFLFVGWWCRPGRLAPILIILWGLLHLAGGAVLTVLPLSLLPFAPEQSLRHYLAHVWYGLAQLPLLILMARQLRRPPVT